MYIKIVHKKLLRKNKIKKASNILYISKTVYKFYNIHKLVSQKGICKYVYKNY